MHNPHSLRRVSRRRLLQGSATALGGLGLGAAAATALGRPGASLTQRDRAVLELALSLEQLQAAFYGQALAAGRLTGEIRQFAEVVGGQEHAHLRYVHAALGGSTAGAQRFDFGSALHDDTHFIRTAARLEDTGVAAYNGQAENLSRPALASVSRIMSVEGRHAAWARDLAGELPAPHPTDAPISARVALSRLRPFTTGS